MIRPHLLVLGGEKAAEVSAGEFLARQGLQQRLQLPLAGPAGGRRRRRGGRLVPGRRGGRMERVGHQVELAETHAGWRLVGRTTFWGVGGIQGNEVGGIQGNEVLCTQVN